MQRQGGLLGKQGAERDKLERAFEWVELPCANMPEQCVRLRTYQDIEMPAKARERGCRVLRRAVFGAANVKELLFPATDAPCVKPEAALEHGAGERRAMQVHAPKATTTGSRHERAIRVLLPMLEMRGAIIARLMRAHSLAASDAAKIRAFVCGVPQVKRSLYLDDLPIQ